MIWLNPSAWIALAALAAPLLIHILVQRKAERLPFPTLRFIQPTRLAAIRRHVLEDALLLAIRAAILAAAAAALAGPLLMTAARRQAWNARIVQAVVVQTVGADLGRPSTPPGAEQAPPLHPGGGGAAPPRPFLSQAFNTPSLPAGLRSAQAWLDAAPPSRREIVVVSPLTLGSMTQDDAAAIPADIGVRFERTGALPEERTVEGGEVLGGARVGPAGPPGRVGPSAGADQRVRPTVRRQSVIVNRASTSVIEAVATATGSFPVDVVGDNSTGPAIAAVLSQRVWTPPLGRHARLVLVGKALDEAAVAGAAAIALPWVADAVARIARDDDLQTAAAGADSALGDSRFGSAPWTVVASASDGRPLAAAAGSPAGLLVVSAADASQIVTPLLLGAIASSLADPPDLRAAEVIPIADAQLQAWTRPTAPVGALRVVTVGQDDRRWLWALVLMLLAAEAWVRRSRREVVEETVERARVA